jgi:hypothetical protein
VHRGVKTVCTLWLTCLWSRILRRESMLNIRIGEYHHECREIGIMDTSPQCRLMRSMLRNNVSIRSTHAIILHGFPSFCPRGYEVQLAKGSSRSDEIWPRRRGDKSTRARQGKTKKFPKMHYPRLCNVFLYICPKSRPGLGASDQIRSSSC